MKKSLIGLLAILLVALLSACSDAEGSSDGKKEIVFNTMELSPTFDDYINGMIESFEEENPDVKVVWEDVPASNIEQKTLTEASSGNMSDVVNLNPRFTKRLAGEGALLNMD